MGCTESRNMLPAVGRKNGKKLTLRWRRWRMRKVENKPDSRTSSRLQNVSGVLSKSPMVSEPNSLRQKSKIEVAMAVDLEKNKSEEIPPAKTIVVEGIIDDDDNSYLDVMEEKIKMWNVASCLAVNKFRSRAAKGPRKPVNDNQIGVDITADVRKLEQDMQSVIDGVDEVKSLSSISNDKKIRTKVGRAFCISQISNDKRVRPGAARGFRTPCTVVSAEEYVLPGAILDVTDNASRPHLGKGSRAHQDRCLQEWMEMQASKNT